MLDPSQLQQQIAAILKESLYNGFNTAMKATYPQQSDTGDRKAEIFSYTMMDIISDPIAEVIAYAVDAYIKNISITGTIITTGTATTQTATITSSPNPSLNGVIPNSLGIS